MKKTLLTTIALLSAISFNAKAECPKFVKVESSYYDRSDSKFKIKETYINACNVSYINKSYIFFNFSVKERNRPKFIEVNQTEEELITLFNSK